MREATFQIRMNTAEVGVKLEGAVAAFASGEGALAVVYLSCNGSELQLGVRNHGDVALLRQLADAAEDVLRDGETINGQPLPRRIDSIWERRVSPTGPNLGRRHND